MVLIMDAGDVITPEHITFRVREAGGLICLTLTEERGAQLNLPLMVDGNNSQPETNFTVSIESQILHDLGVGKMRLLSSPTRFNAISGFDLEVVEFLENV